VRRVLRVVASELVVVLPIDRPEIPVAVPEEAHSLSGNHADSEQIVGHDLASTSKRQQALGEP